MKKKICIKLSINRDKCRRKAMEIAVSAKGVISVAIEGEYEDELVVVGDGVDAACLVDALRKKACYATLESLEEVTPDILSPDDDEQILPQENNDTDESNNVETIDDDDDDDQMMTEEDNDTDESNNSEAAAADDDDSPTNQIVPPHCCVAHCPSFHYQQPRPERYEVVYKSYGPSNRCTIM